MTASTTTTTTTGAVAASNSVLVCLYFKCDSFLVSTLSAVAALFCGNVCFREFVLN